MQRSALRWRFTGDQAIKQQLEKSLTVEGVMFSLFENFRICFVSESCDFREEVNNRILHHPRNDASKHLGVHTGINFGINFHCCHLLIDLHDRGLPFMQLL
eukprot:Blabericola_migrator_1__6741@NODE_3406_length_1803_cov_7_155530_g2121_i0_p2_GENE_NODE_3406_length_1803_cov_7_155530_g2121_i0NODE_3406_length_1803_cov_7_155530_g2121_i0_p2_ORF_typecomplete_len101_score8_60_NODE_3406_length_1803_cov_7_155530_g2121_i011961498